MDIMNLDISKLSLEEAENLLNSLQDGLSEKIKAELQEVVDEFMSTLKEDYPLVFIGYGLKNRTLKKQVEIIEALSNGDINGAIEAAIVRPKASKDDASDSGNELE